MNKIISTADVPKRSSGTITLSWGLMNMSLSLFSGTEDVAPLRKEFVEGDPNRPAGRAIIDKTSGDIVDRSQVERLVEASNGAWVTVTDDEMASAIGVKNVAEVLTFVPVDEGLRSYVQDGYYQVRPHATKGKVDPASAQAFALLSHVLIERNLAALVRLATRGPARYALITGEGDMYYVHSSDEVRRPLSLQLPDVAPEHVDMANQLVDAVGINLPILPNETASKIQQIADAKAAGVVVPERQAPVLTPAVDLVAQLQASIAANKATKAWGAPTGEPVKTEEVAA